MNIMLLFIALFVAFLWGVTPIIHKTLLKTISPNAILILGGTAYYVALLVYAAYNWDTFYAEAKTISWSKIIWISIATLIMSFLAKLLYLQLLQKEDSYIVTALTFSAPVVTTILAVSILRERVTLSKLIGVAFIVAGVVVLALSDNTLVAF